jgi:demethylmenaquinone methyltransferase/2-methoxy-6-polyprenyl-1,4-benzoquinol methylase
VTQIDADHLPRGDEKAVAVRAMFDRIAPRYDLVNRIMTFGLDVGWRRRTVRELSLPTRSRVLDIACGTGDLCRELERAAHVPIGVDFSIEMLRHARTTAALLQGDALRLPVPSGHVDGVTSGFALRNFADLGAFLTEIGRVVRPSGRIALLEVAEPDARVLQWGHRVYFGKVVPRIGGLFSDGSAYRYLPKSLAYLPPTEAMVRMVRAAGFVDVQRHVLTAGVAQLIVGTRDPAGRS